MALVIVFDLDIVNIYSNCFHCTEFLVCKCFPNDCSMLFHFVISIVFLQYCVIRMLHSNFSINSNRLWINRLVIDNRNFNMQSQSGTHHALCCHRNMVSGWRRLQCTVPRRHQGKTNGRRRCWRCRGGKIPRSTVAVWPTDRQTTTVV